LDNFFSFVVLQQIITNQNIWSSGFAGVFGRSGEAGLVN